MMVCTASGARQCGMHTSRATYSAVFSPMATPLGGSAVCSPGLARPSFSICVAGVALPLVRCNCSRAPRIVPSIRALSDHSMLRVRRRGAPYGLPPRKWERSEAPSALWFVGLAVVPRAACPTCASRPFPQFMFAPMRRFRQILPQPPHSTSGPPKDERRTLRSTFGAPKDERRTPCSTFGAPKERRTENVRGAQRRT